MVSRSWFLIVGGQLLRRAKVLQNGTVTPKTRLVARWFQEADKYSLDTASATVDRGVWAVMVAMTAVHGWVPYCFDISTAFLQGRPITRDVFLRPPPEIGEPAIVMKLNKRVYGLVDATVQSYEALNEGIVASGGLRLPYDKCTSMWYADNDSLLVMLCAHVDDLYCSADPSFEDSMLVKLRALFPVGKDKEGDFIYCGLQVSTEPDGNGQVTSILADQRTYVDTIVPMQISNSTGSQNRCLERQERSDYRGILRALLWERGLIMHTDWSTNRETCHSSEQTIESHEEARSGVTVPTTDRRATAHWISPQQLRNCRTLSYRERLNLGTISKGEIEKRKVFTTAMEEQKTTTRRKEQLRQSITLIYRSAGRPLPSCKLVEGHDQDRTRASEIAH